MRYTARRKLALLAAAKRLQEKGRLLQSVADKLHVSVANLSRWGVQKIDKVNPMDLLFTKKKKAVHPGLLSQLMAIEEPLPHYIFELHEQGQTINTFVIMLQADRAYGTEISPTSFVISFVILLYAISYNICI